MSESSLFLQPSTGRRPAAPSRQGSPVPEGQLQLKLAIGGPQNGSQHPAPGPAPRDPGRDGAQSAPNPVSRHAGRPTPATSLTAWAAAEGLSGRRRDPGGRIGFDDPASALPPSGCVCARPLPAVDPEGREVRCHKCGRRS